MSKFDFPGDIHFLTFNTFWRYPYFKDEKCCQLFLENLEFYRGKYELKIYGYALLHDHMHLLVSFDQEKFSGLTISKVVQDLKSFIARQIIDFLKLNTGSREPLLSVVNSYGLEQGLQPTQAENSKGHKRGLKYRLWQPGFYDYNIYSLDKFNQKLEYINKNPIKHGLVPDIAQYKYCSWRNYELEDNSIFKIDYLEY